MWGQQNELPLIAVNKIFINNSDVAIMGRNHDTIKFKVNGVEYIKFFASSLIPEFEKYNEMAISLVGKPTINEYMGSETPQIMIEDLEISNSELLF